MRRHPAFTLLELLIVVAIIGLLITIFFPALRRARIQSRRTACAANLRQVGVGFESYLAQNNDRYPHASLTPSINPSPLPLGSDPIYVADVLLEHVGDDPMVFKCPNDEPDGARGAPNSGKSFFQSERSSYEYRNSPFPFLRLGGLTAQEFVDRYKTVTNRTVPDNMFWVMRDYRDFHGPAGEVGNRRYLYSDGHVADHEY